MYFTGIPLDPFFRGNKFGVVMYQVFLPSSPYMPSGSSVDGGGPDSFDIARYSFPLVKLVIVANSLTLLLSSI